jgi:beta-mannosidase
MLAAVSTTASPPHTITLDQGWTFRQQGKPDGAWMPATVPGCVHTDLLASKKIADPFYRTNEKDQQWIENASWEYRTSFKVDREVLAHDRVDLVFKGLDTYARVSLNGRPLLTANNMFREWRADAKRLLKEGDNQLVILFASPIETVMPAYQKLGYVLPAVNDQAEKRVSIFTRKAPYHYGWDWGPRLVTAGVWRPVLLQAWSGARIVDVQVVQGPLTDQVAKLSAVVEVEAARAGKALLSLRLRGKEQLATREVQLRRGVNKTRLEFEIAEPRRWWPAGMGEQALYPIDVDAALPGGEAVAPFSTRVGLRTIEVVHQKDKDGKSFFFKVNGVPVFMKGANYIPSDSFPSRVTADRYRSLLQSAVDANMNMLRVWGGGIYEDDKFYDLCDELGLLVWQDFMFGCSLYPGDKDFLENVRQEAIENVRRLRNHPSVAIWAGNNESEAAWVGWGWQKQFGWTKQQQARIWGDYKKLFHVLLPKVCKEHDPGRFYTRSSPSANDDALPVNKVGFGDMHFWGVWHAQEPYESYKANTSRFMSEYGFQSFPELETVKSYTLPTDWNIESPVMLSHQRHPRGNQLIREYMQRDYRTPRDFPSFLYVGQLLQAEIIRFAAEAHRRRMPYCMGSLYWQLDDCWPVASWSGMDYHLRWKALHYYARRFFAPVLVSPTEDGGVVSVHLVSDRQKELAGRLVVRLQDFAGKVLSEVARDVRVPAGSSASYHSVPRAELLKGVDPGKVVLVAELREKTTPLGRSLFYFAKAKDLTLPAPQLAVNVSRAAAGGVTVSLTAGRLAKNVYLGGVTIPGRFSDNYFDLLAGETVNIDFRTEAPATIDLEAFQKALAVRTLVDTF